MKKQHQYDNSEIKPYEYYARINSYGRFLRVWIYPFCDALKGLGESQLKCCLYLLMARNKNCYIMGTIDELSAAIKVNRDTICSTIRHLIDHDLLVRVKNGVLMMNPAMVYSSSDASRVQHYMIYRSIQKRKGKASGGDAVYCDDGSFLYDAKTGEVISDIELPKGESFLKVRKYRFAQALCGISRCQITICLYLLKHLGSDGRVYVSRKQLSHECGISEVTVRQTIHHLETTDFLCRERRGCIMINPSIVCYDIKYNRDDLQLEYWKIQKQKQKAA